tara:strand:- start:1196 stop:1426 length:231 start_codon:yes stop_codon:yes gene_type:complete
MNLRHATGPDAVGDPMHVLNHLQLIKDQLLKARRLSDAQFLHLKAYRGVPYQAAPVEKMTGAKVATYRGSTYKVGQ